MSLAALAKQLADAGTPIEGIILALEAVESRDRAAAQKREQAAERKRRQRDRERDCHATVTGHDEDIPAPAPSLDKSPQTPKINPIPGVCVGDAPTREARPFSCPDGVDPQHWSDFLANRKRRGMANTATAYRGQLRELANLSDDEWPPGRLVQHAAEKGWGGIHDPRQSANGTQNGNRPANDRNPHRRSDEIDLALDRLGFGGQPVPFSP